MSKNLLLIMFGLILKKDYFCGGSNILAKHLKDTKKANEEEDPFKYIAFGIFLRRYFLKKVYNYNNKEENPFNPFIVNEEIINIKDDEFDDFIKNENFDDLKKEFSKKNFFSEMRNCDELFLTKHCK